MKDVEFRLIAIKKHVSIFDVLDKFEINYPHGRLSQQILCPFHHDRRPSARVYSDTNKVYCFTCARTWDQIAIVREKLGVRDLQQVVEWFESRFQLPSLRDNIALAVEAQLGAHRQPNLAEMYAMVEDILIEARHRMDLQQYINRLYALDIIAYKRSTNAMTAEEARCNLQELLNRLQRL